jgi:hypothetical protein
MFRVKGLNLVRPLSRSKIVLRLIIILLVLNKTQQLSATKQTFEPANLRDLTLQVIRELKNEI